MRVYSNFRHTMSWSITQFNFGTNPYFTHAPGIAIRCEPTGSLPHCAGVANDCYCWSCFLNGDEIPTAIEHHKNLQDVRDVCACQKFVEWGMRYALRILGASISLHWFVASTGCPGGAGKCLSKASSVGRSNRTLDLTWPSSRRRSAAKKSLEGLFSRKKPLGWSKLEHCNVTMLLGYIALSI